MKKANIATAKNQFSRLIQQVKRGESILITDRNKPVAQLTPVRETNEILSRLIAEGVVLPAEGPALDVEKLFSLPLPKESEKKALSKAVLEEREEGW